MLLLPLVLLLSVTSSCLASHQNVAQETTALIPSASSMQPVPSFTSPAAQIDQRRHSKHVNDFYKLYGWLKPNTSVPDSDLTKAIRKIQRKLKEPVTGVFSEKMTQIMTGPRCGTEQPYNETDAKASSDLHERYVLWGPKWAKTTLTWRFVNYSPDLSTEIQQSTIITAFAQWMNFIPLNIVPAAATAGADIYIRFASFGRDDTRYGYTSMVTDGVSLSSGNINVTFNEDYQWSDDRLFNFTAVHEIGHALGLSHSGLEAAVMFAYYDANIRPIHSDDKMGIHSIYGWKSPKWSRIESNTATKNMIQVTSTSDTVANDGLYQMRSTGQILRYSSGTWANIDNNPDTAQIAGSGGNLYQRHADGSTFLWTGSSSGWQYIGAASENVIDIVAAAGQLYSRRKDGWVVRWSGSGTAWLTIDQPSTQISKQIAITDSKTLWNILSNGDIVRSYWPYNSGEWRIVDVNSANTAIATGGDNFYKLQSDGKVIWLNTKDPTYIWWDPIEDAGSVAIHAAGDFLYSKHGDGTVWRYTGTEGVWEQLDDRKDVVSMVGDRNGNIWEMMTSGEIWRLVS